MLTQQTIQTVQSTIPLLEEHGTAITSAFYQKLFTDYPFLKNMFNQTNQEKGKQQRALSDAVIAYAKHIDNLDALLPTVRRIANKHVSLGVKKAHYPVVGKVLLSSIQSVLGLEDGHPALKAWAEAYGLLANVLVSAEDALVKEKKDQEGGFEGFRDFYIEKINDEATGVKSFYFQPFDLEPVPDFLAGQYVGVRVQTPNDGLSKIRQYSLSKKGSLRITVKAEPNGVVSNHLHTAKVGDAVQLQVPTGDFIHHRKHKKTLFIAGGVGITPLISMTQAAIDEGCKKDELLFIQCARDANHQIFKEDFMQWVEEEKIQHRLSFSESDEGAHRGIIDEEILSTWLNQTGFSARNTEVYFCGPKPFMVLMSQLCRGLGFTDEQLHYEVFGPTEVL